MEGALEDPYSGRNPVKVVFGKIKQNHSTPGTQNEKRKTKNGALKNGVVQAAESKHIGQ